MNTENPYNIKFKTRWDAKKVLSMNRVVYLSFNVWNCVASVTVKNRNNRKDIYNNRIEICQDYGVKGHLLDEPVTEEVAIASLTKLIDDMKKDLCLRDNEIL